MLKNLFQEQRERINYFFDRIDLEAAENLLTMFYECRGVIFFTGIGKSGLIAQKIATTLTSVNVKSLFLSSVDALHGDIGILSQDDIFVLLSRSGESEELLQLVPFLRNKGVKLVALVCEKNSRLAKACDFEMVLPMQKEICPFGLMPTTSSAVQMIFCDILATELMVKNRLKIEDYRMNHPAGRIGRRMTLKVKDLMLTGEKLPVCSPNDKIMDTLVTLSNKQCGCIVVVGDSGEMLGIFTDGDLRRTLQDNGPDALNFAVRDVMTLSPRWTTADRLAVDAMKVMEEDQKHPITVLPVLEEHKVVGLIKIHDILQSGV